MMSEPTNPERETFEEFSTRFEDFAVDRAKEELWDECRRRYGRLRGFFYYLNNVGSDAGIVQARANQILYRMYHVQEEVGK